MILQQEWTDIDDFMEKYGLENNPEAYSNWMSVASFFHGIGILVKKGRAHAIANIIHLMNLLSYPCMGRARNETRSYAGSNILRIDFGGSELL